MGFITNVIDFILHIDTHLVDIVNEYGTLTYLILFMIIFCETGLVFTPFLPGDSLIFATGTICAMGAMNFTLILIILLIAAITGNLVNFFIGRTVGEKILTMKSNRFIKKEYIERTQKFYDKHGGKAIILSRFMPIIRTFAPFVAGIGKMNFIKFFIYNLIGGVSWVCLFLAAGYLFGNFPFVKENFEFIALAIILISLLPALITFIKTKLSTKAVV